MNPFRFDPKGICSKMNLRPNPRRDSFSKGFILKGWLLTAKSIYKIGFTHGEKVENLPDFPLISLAFKFLALRIPMVSVFLAGKYVRLTKSSPNFILTGGYKDLQ